MCDEEINVGLPREQEQQGSKGPTIFLFVFPSYTGGERAFGLMSVFLMISKRIPEPCECSSHKGKRTEKCLHLRES